LYSIIVPVYKNEESIFDLIKVFSAINRKLRNRLTVVFVVDGSPDHSFELLNQYLPLADFKSRLILHSKNFGSFAAIRTGLKFAEDNYYAVMAADLQEPPSLVMDFYKILKEDNADIVIGVRDGRRDPVQTKIFSSLFWWMYRRFVVPAIPKGGVDIFGCNRKVRDKMLEFHESNSSLVAQLFWIGFRRSFVKYQRREREKGKSAWTFRKKINYLMDSVFAFTDLPIRLLIWMGGIGVLISFFIGIIVLLFKATGYISVSGYTALMITLIFFGALNLLGLGIIGAYAHRTYDNTKARPLSIVTIDKKIAGRKTK